MTRGEGEMGGGGMQAGLDDPDESKINCPRLIFLNGTHS